MKKGEGRTTTKALRESFMGGQRKSQRGKRDEPQRKKKKTKEKKETPKNEP